MQWGMNKGVAPYQFGANINGTWSNLGTVSSGGVWSIPTTNITGLGTASAQNIGTSGANVPLLNGTNTWSGAQTFSSSVVLNNANATASNIMSVDTSLSSPYSFGAKVGSSWYSLGTVTSLGAWSIGNASFAASGTNWTTGTSTYHYEGFPFAVDTGLPNSAKFGYGYGSMVEGISASMDVPAGSNVLGAYTIAGYVRTRGAPYSVGVFGGCMQSASSTGGCWGLNTVSTNGPTIQPVTQTGYDFGFLGTELDINVIKKSDGSAPSGNVIGLFLIGASETGPAAPSSADAIRVSQLGVGANIKWNTSMLLADGASNYGIWRGVSEKTGNSLGSIRDVYVSKDSGGSTLVSYLGTDSTGNFYMDPAGGKVQVNGGVQLKHQSPITFPDAGGAIPGSNGGSIFNTSGTTYFDSYSGAIQMRGNAYASIANFATTGVTLSVPLKLTNTVISTTAPTIGSGFGTSPTIVASNGTAAFQVNVGTGGTASSGVITMPAAVNGWSCSAADVTTQSSSVFLTKQTASTTTSVTITNYNTAGAATAWVASDKINMMCMAF